MAASRTATSGPCQAYLRPLGPLGGFAQTLYRVLVTLGVPDELVKVTCTRKSAQEGGIEGPVVTSVEFPASTTLPSVPAFTELTIEDTVEEGLRAVSQGTSQSDEGPL